MADGITQLSFTASGEKLGIEKEQLLSKYTVESRGQMIVGEMESSNVIKKEQESILLFPLPSLIPYTGELRRQGGKIPICARPGLQIAEILSADRLQIHLRSCFTLDGLRTGLSNMLISLPYPLREPYLPTISVFIPGSVLSPRVFSSGNFRL